jgi:hypothetical protein
MTPPRNPEPPVAAGDVLQLRDEDYRYGRGPLTLRVSAVHTVQRLADGPWVFLRGTELAPDGRELAQRDVLVRVAALRRPAGGGPGAGLSGG